MLITGDQLMPEKEDEKLGKDKYLTELNAWSLQVRERKERRGGKLNHEI